jgi:riboflavin kinase / FMN adenylyltransferase
LSIDHDKNNNLFRGSVLSTHSLKLFHYKNLAELDALPQKRCMAIGVFDGLHPGHQLILSQVRGLALTKNLVPCLWTFGNDLPKPGFERLMSERQYFRALEASGVQEVHRMDFIEEVTRLNAKEFLTQVLINKLAVTYIVLGADACLGRQRSTCALEFKNIASEMGVTVDIVQLQRADWGEWSSSQMREWIRQGEFNQYQQALGRSYAFGGIVVKDQGLAHQLGYPTANLEMKDYVCPPLGVYNVRVKLPDRDNAPEYLGLAYIGTRPTVNSTQRMVLEVHLKNFTGDLYGEYIEVSDFLFLRSETKFASLETLQQQIKLDVEGL